MGAASTRLPALSCVVLICSLGAAEAQGVSSLAELSTRVPSGQQVYVRNSGGWEVSGTFLRVSDSMLSLMVDGKPHDIPVGEVREVARRGDSVWNGFLIGAAFGALMGALESGEGEQEVDLCTPGAACRLTHAVLVAPTLGGIGALIDRFIVGRTVVFRVPSTALRLRPSWSVTQGGVWASVVLSGS